MDSSDDDLDFMYEVMEARKPLKPLIDLNLVENNVLQMQQSMITDILNEIKFILQGKYPNWVNSSYI